MSDLNQSPNQKDQLDLVYGLNDRPSPFIAFLAAFQHLLAIIVPIVTPGLLICLALGVSKEDTNMILSMSLVISGIATFLQCKKVGPFGAGLLIVQGTSFNFIGPIIGIGSAMVAAGTPVESCQQCWIIKFAPFLCNIFFNFIVIRCIRNKFLCIAHRCHGNYHYHQ